MPPADGVQYNALTLLQRAARMQRLARALMYPAPGQRRELVALLEAQPDAALAPVLHAWRAADDDALAAEYNRLFLGAAACPLNESAWASSKQLTGGAAELADIQGFYHAFGFEAASAHDMPDHISTELEFIGALLMKLAYARLQEWHEAGAVTEAALRSFLEAHSGRWVHALMQRLHELAAAAPYAAAAGAIVAAVDGECAEAAVQPVRSALTPRLAEPAAPECGVTAPRTGSLPVLSPEYMKPEE